MSPTTARRLAVVVCVAGIAGMIATSVADSVEGALVFGLLTAVAVLGLILVTAVTTPRGAAGPGEEEAGQRVETGVQALVTAGAEEGAVRRLVGDAIRLGRDRANPGGARSVDPTASRR